MRSRIITATVLATAAALASYWIYRHTPEPEIPDTPLSDLVDMTLGDDAQNVGCLTEPVTARVLVYPAAGNETVTRVVTIMPGTWLVPADSMHAPY